MVTLNTDVTHHFNPGVDRDGRCDTLHVMPPLRRDIQHLARLKDYLKAIAENRLGFLVLNGYSMV